MGFWVLYLDTFLLPLCVLLVLVYHAFLCYSYKNKPHLTSIAFNTYRRTWVTNITQDNNDSKSGLSVQSLRNTILASILSAAIAVAMTSSLAAFTNNTYNGRHLLMNSIFGSQSIGFRDLKFAAASVSLITSFLLSSMAVGCFVEAQFLISLPMIQGGYVENVFERGFVLAFLGNRALQLSFPLLLWMLGPVPLVVSSLTMIWLQYELDFAGNQVHKVSSMKQRKYLWRVI